MEMSLIQAIATVGMVGVAITLTIAFRRCLAAASERRMLRMLERVGLDHTAVWGADTRTIMNQVRQLCQSCASEDVCERWLAGDKGGKNAFCPNAKVFEILKKKVDAHG